MIGIVSVCYVSDSVSFWILILWNSFFNNKYHFTAAMMFPFKNAFLRLSCDLIISKGIIFSIPLVLQIYLLISLLYGVQIKRNINANPIINIENFIFSNCY